jgi:phage baseplate assembly protein W
MAEVAISIPFKIDAYGRIAQASSQQKIWADRVLSVIGTRFRERVMLPTFGTNITDFTYEGIETAVAGIEAAVEKAFLTQLPTLNLLDVVITRDDLQGNVLVDITYELPNDTETNTVVAIVAVGGKNPPVQENL